MSKPKVERIGTALKFDWPDYKVVVTLDRFREGRSSGTHAELTVRTTANGYSNTLTAPQEINLVSFQTRGQFAKRMAELYDKANWNEVIETTCQKGVELFREGEPVVRLTGDGAVEPPKYVIDPLVFEDHSAVLFGLGKSGKSSLALFVAMLTETGGSLGGLRVNTPYRGLYLDWEAEEKSLKYRAHTIRNGFPPFKNCEPRYRRCTVPLADDLHNIQRIVAEEGIKLVVIDSLGPAAGAELMSAETAMKFFSALRSLKVASLIVAHTAKNSEEKSIYGSVFFGNLARNIWEVRKVQDIGEDTIRVGLFNRANNLGPLHRPMGFKMTFGNAFLIERVDLAEVPELEAPLPAKERVKNALKDGAKIPQEIADETGIPLSSVKGRLSDGKKEGWSVQLGGGKWGLLHHD